MSRITAPAGLKGQRLQFTGCQGGRVGSTFAARQLIDLNDAWGLQWEKLLWCDLMKKIQ